MAQISSTATPDDRKKLSLGSCIRMGWSVISRNAFRLIGVTLAVYVPFLVVWIVVFRASVIEASPALDGTETRDPWSMLAGLAVPIFAALAFYWLSSTLVFATIAAAVFEAGEGGRFRMGRALRATAARLVPLAGIAAVFFAAAVVILIGINALAYVAKVLSIASLPLSVAAMAMLAASFVATVPAAVAERLGVLDSFRRGAELARGNRWRILVILSTAAAAGAAGSFAIGFVVVNLWIVLVDAVGASTLLNPFDYLPGIVQTLFAVFLAVTATAIYMNLWLLKDGGGAAH